MKVELKEPEVTFKPIVITLETREEADVLWNKLHSDSRAGYAPYRYYQNSTNLAMWNALNKIHDPRK